MIPLVQLIGLLVFGFGLVMLAAPALMRRVLGWAKEGKRVYLFATLRMLMGACLFLVIPVARLRELALVLGTMLFVSGGILFTAGPAKLAGLFDWWLAQSNTVLRLMALMAVLFGVLIIYVV